jgi:hypothetical protein
MDTYDVTDLPLRDPCMVGGPIDFTLQFTLVYALTRCSSLEPIPGGADISRHDTHPLS